MYRTASIAAYDVMDTVFITATVRLYDSLQPGVNEVEIHTATTVDGLGSGEGAVWLRDALVALAETL